MAHGEKVNLISREIVGINNPVVTDPEAAMVASGHSIVWVAGEVRAHRIDGRFDPMTDFRGQPQERAVESRVVDLERSTHLGAINGSADAGLRPFRVRNS